MEPSLEVQKLIRQRLIATSAVTAMVPAANIVDRSGIPNVFPSILIGDGQTTVDEGLSRNRHVAYFDLHVWVKETGTAGSKQITGAIRGALFDGVWTVPGLHIADLYITSSRFLRDPGGQHSHAVISLQAYVLETA